MYQSEQSTWLQAILILFDCQPMGSLRQSRPAASLSTHVKSVRDDKGIRDLLSTMIAITLSYNNMIVVAAKKLRSYQTSKTFPKLLLAIVASAAFHFPDQSQ